MEAKDEGAAASKEKKGVRFVSMIIITMQGNVLYINA